MALGDNTTSAATLALVLSWSSAYLIQATWNFATSGSDKGTDYSCTNGESSSF